MRETGGYIRFYNGYNSAVLLKTLWLMSVDKQLTIPSAWKLQGYFLATVPNSSPPGMYGHVTFSDFPFWALTLDLILSSFILKFQ